MSGTLKQHMLSSIADNFYVDNPRQFCNASERKAVEEDTLLVGAGPKFTLFELQDLQRYERNLKEIYSTQKVVSDHVL